MTCIFKDDTYIEVNDSAAVLIHKVHYRPKQCQNTQLIDGCMSLCSPIVITNKKKFVGIYTSTSKPIIESRSLKYQRNFEKFSNDCTNKTSAYNTFCVLIIRQLWAKKHLRQMIFNRSQINKQLFNKIHSHIVCMMGFQKALLVTPVYKAMHT